MVVSRKKFISGSILLIVLVLIIFYIFNDIDMNGKSFLTIVGFSIIGILSILSIIKDARVISTNKFFWYFQFVFMSIAPLCQYLSGYFPWGVRISESDIEIGVFLTIVWDIVYLLSYGKRGRRIKRGTIGRKLKDLELGNRDYSRLFLIIVFFSSILGFALLVKMIGFYNLFFRSENMLDIENSTINFIVRKLLTALPAMVCAMFILTYKRRKSPLLLVGIISLIAIAICANFPTSTTRYWMGTIFIGIAMIATIQRKESRIVDYGIVFGLLVAFPLFYIFKTMTIEDLFNGNVNFGGIVNSFNTVDFDAFTIMARSIRYVRENGITWGNQLLNIILFFIPRGIWKNKPITTNVLIASAQNQRFTNLSCPLTAEGYVNFGIVGLVLYCIVYAKINRALDDMYWENSDDSKINIINIVYPFLCVITLYINRGPLQPAFIQTIALILPLIIINFFNKTIKTGKNNYEE